MSIEHENAKNNLPEQLVVAPIVVSQDIQVAQKTAINADKNEPSNSSNKSGGRGKGKKRKSKMPKDITAPRQPLTGYVRYLNERRDHLRATDPSLSFADVTKRLASEWGRLPAEEKQQYLDAAEQDRERYIKEWSIYKESDAYKAFKQQQQERKDAEQGVKATGREASPPPKRQKGGSAANKPNKGDDVNSCTAGSNNTFIQAGNGTQPAVQSIGTNQASLNSYGSALTRPKAAVTPSSVPTSATFPDTLSKNGLSTVNNTNGSNNSDINQRETDIPIFTEQFLQHNKLRETELRQLRKANTDYEQQNAILQKHIESMRGAVERTKDEIVSQKARTSLLRGHLTALQEKLVRGLINVSLPGGPRGATKQNLEQYMESLKNLAVENKNNAAVKQAREFFSKMEMSV